MYETTLSLIGTDTKEVFHWTDDDQFKALMALDDRLESINFSVFDIGEITIKRKGE